MKKCSHIAILKPRPQKRQHSGNMLLYISMCAHACVFVQVYVYIHAQACTHTRMCMYMYLYRHLEGHRTKYQLWWSLDNETAYNPFLNFFLLYAFLF